MQSQAPVGSGLPILSTGAALTEARAVVLLLHGRGGTAEDILNLSSLLGVEDTAFLAPQAEGNSWYPYSFLAPIERNEPSLSRALATVESVIALAVEAGLAREKIVLAGFSQGACLALEYAGRHPGRYGGVVALSGGRIGPPGTTWSEEGHFGDTPVFLGCSDIDAHIPLERVKESSAHFRSRGASVIERIYPGMGHTVNDDEIHLFQQLLKSVEA